ncbi:MAG: hypothetical protein ACQ5SW_06690 [Sphaerochaetaceae bacterium]
MKEIISLVTLLIVLSFPLVAMETREFQAEYEPLLPLDATIGQIVEGEPGSAEEATREALGGTYSPAWIERYVSETFRKAFVNTYETLLLSLLPADQLQVGKATIRTNLYEVPFCIHMPVYRWGTMGWTRDEAGKWVLLTVSVNHSNLL